LVAVKAAASPPPVAEPPVAPAVPPVVALLPEVVDLLELHAARAVMAATTTANRRIRTEWVTCTICSIHSLGFNPKQQ
jgi:hypothetical protein